jgi:hypothetical protein
MHSPDAIEAINFDQLATPTDRLLLRGLRAAKRRPSVPSLAHHSALAAERSSRASIAPIPSLAARAPLARGSELHLEQTLHVRGDRPRRAPRRDVLAFTVVMPVLLGIAVGLAAML